MSADKTPEPHHSKIDGHRLAEFIYGTVVALIAMGGIDPNHTGWALPFTLIVLGGISIWIAHAYAMLMSNRVVSKTRISGSDIRKTLTDSWPIVSAALIVAMPLAGTALSLYSTRTALLLASSTGILILAMVGYLAGIVSRESRLHRVFLVLLSSGLGLLVILVKTLAHPAAG